MTESVKKEEHKSLEATTNVGGEIVTVRVGSDELRRDLVLEAVAQGIDRSKAEELAGKVQFGLNELEASIGGDVGGEVDPVQLTCSINPEAFASKFNSTLGGKGIPREARHQWFGNAILETWRHERQHLIQQLKPVPDETREAFRKREDEYEKHFVLAGTYLKATVVTAVVGIGSAFFIQDLRPTGLAFVLTCVSGYKAVSKAIEGNLQRYKDLPVEVDAREHSQSDTISGRKSPFEIIFESRV